MHRTQHQENDEPPHQQNKTLRMVGQPVELNGEADAEKERKHRERLQLERRRQKVFQRPVDGGAGGRQKLLENGNAETRTRCLIVITPNRANPRRTSMPSIRVPTRRWDLARAPPRCRQKPDRFGRDHRVRPSS